MDTQNNKESMQRGETDIGGAMRQTVVGGARAPVVRLPVIPHQLLATIAHDGKDAHVPRRLRVAKVGRLTEVD